MKKITAIATAAMLMTSLALTAYAEGTSSVTVTNAAGKSVTYNYESGAAEVKSITPIMSELDKLSVAKRSVSQAVTVNSLNTDNMQVDMYLRLSADASSKATTAPKSSESPEALKSIANTILEGYIVEVKDASNNIVYSTDLDGRFVYAEEGKYISDMYLGRLNEQSEEENKVYTINVKLPEGTSAAELSKLSKVDWSIVTKPGDNEPVPTPIATRRPTPTPVSTVASSTASTPAAVKTPVPTAAAAPTAEPSATPEVLKGGGTKKIGKGLDIVPGKYTATGTGMVKIYDKDGTLKTNIKLKSADDKSESGVESYVLTLNEGETLEYEDKLNLKPYSTTKSTAAPKSTTKATTAPKATATPSPKTNPKTGDNTPVAGMSAVGVFGLGMFVFMEIERRRKSNK